MTANTPPFLPAKQLATYIRPLVSSVSQENSGLPRQFQTEKWISDTEQPVPESQCRECLARTKKRRRNYSLAEPMKRVYEFEVSKCRDCNGRLTIRSQARLCNMNSRHCHFRLCSSVEDSALLRKW